jgi:hypothetical protein
VQPRGNLRDEQRIQLPISAASCTSRQSNPAASDCLKDLDLGRNMNNSRQMIKRVHLQLALVLWQPYFSPW